MPHDWSGGFNSTPVPSITPATKLTNKNQQVSTRNGEDTANVKSESNDLKKQ